MELQYLNRSVRLPSTMSEYAERLDGVDDDWQMNDTERAALLALVSTLKPKCAIEVGVYKGGSLAILAAHSSKVYALDINPACETAYAGKYPNVSFITGSSEHTLPKLIEAIQASGESLDFVFIDGDHTEKGVRRDIESVLQYRPKNPLYILLHDSFNPGCRKGMREAMWSHSPYVHFVELDFTTGRFVSNKESRGYREMWNGFALAGLLPQERTRALTVHENESLLFHTAFQHSVHRPESRWNPAVHARRLRRAAHLLVSDFPTFCAAIKRRIVVSRT